MKVALSVGSVVDCGVEKWHFSTIYSRCAEKLRNETEGRGKGFPSAKLRVAALFVRLFVFAFVYVCEIALPYCTSCFALISLIQGNVLSMQSKISHPQIDFYGLIYSCSCCVKVRGIALEMRPSSEVKPVDVRISMLQACLEFKS